MQDTAQRLINIVEENFYNGIRDDFIDTSKILRLFSYYYPNEIIFRESVVEIIHSNAIENKGRFYFIAPDTVETIQYFLDEILKKNSLAYYTAIYRKHFDFFTRLHISSPDVLKKTLHCYDKRHFHFPEFCAINKTAYLDYEVEKIFTRLQKPLSLEDLIIKLPYVPAEKIAAALSDTKKYFLTQKRFYFLFDQLKFDVAEIDSVKNKLRCYIAENGDANIEDCDFSSTFSQNMGISEKDLQNIIYEKFLSHDFTKRGNKLFKKGTSDKNNTASIIAKFKKFLDTQDEIPAKKLFAAAQNFGIDSSATLAIAHEKMIRTDKNFFVKDSLIKFDVAKVDAALADFVQDKIIPLRAVTSFTSFPPIKSYSWNLFLLESFLRKYSRQYIFNSPTFNSVNVGSIYPKFMKFADYLDVQTAVIIQEKIPLKKLRVESFLVEHGFRTNRIDSVTEKIIRKAQEILNR